MLLRAYSLITALVIVFGPGDRVFAQSTVPSITLPTVTVTAQKEPADPLTLPVSVGTAPDEWLRAARITTVSDAAIFAPNVVFTEFTARKLSNARVRGVGSSPANAAVTTYIDGVPQLNANVSSLELTGVGQVEFVRGPQSALFGRNTLGGVINVLSRRPSTVRWEGDVAAPFGNFSSRELRANVSGPVTSTVAIGIAGGHSERDGFSTNVSTGNDVDSRSATFAKAQVLFAPSTRWETRVIVSGERAEDGDYALNDLAAVRSTPFVVARDFEGYTNRDIFNLTVLNRYEGARVSLTATTGIVNWGTEDATDLDYTPLPIATRLNNEDASQFTQEVRVASAPSAAFALSSAASLRWQAGVLLFGQNYEQNAVNNLGAFALSPLVPFPVQQTSPLADLDDLGIGIYGQGTVTLRDSLALTVGARIDRERREARIETFFTPAIAPPGIVDAEETFANISPQLSVAYRLPGSGLAYVSAARGFKAGGFNPTSPVGSESFGEEHTWNLEGGVKRAFAGGRVAASAAVFFIDWNELQLNLPNPQVPAQFYIANVGEATSRGLELEVSARPMSGVDLFSTFGYTRARFGSGTTSGGLDVSGNRVPFTPGVTFTAGAQATRDIASRVSLYGRGELASYGSFSYDESDTAEQEAYALVNLRVGARARMVFAELWLRNAFDTRYVPIAFAYPGLAPSGYVGEPGRPRTFGVSVGVDF